MAVQNDRFKNLRARLPRGQSVNRELSQRRSSRGKATASLTALSGFAHLREPVQRSMLTTRAARRFRRRVSFLLLSYFGRDLASFGRQLFAAMPWRVRYSRTALAFFIRAQVVFHRADVAGVAFDLDAKRGVLLQDFHRLIEERETSGFSSAVYLSKSNATSSNDTLWTYFRFRCEFEMAARYLRRLPRLRQRLVIHSVLQRIRRRHPAAPACRPTALRRARSVMRNSDLSSKTTRPPPRQTRRSVLDSRSDRGTLVNRIPATTPCLWPASASTNRGRRELPCHRSKHHFGGPGKSSVPVALVRSMSRGSAASPNGSR